VAAIVDFRDQLAALGIRLVVMPAPNKESIYPDRLNANAAIQNGMLHLAPRTQDLLERLRKADVEVVDLFEEFVVARPLPGAGHPLVTWRRCAGGKGRVSAAAETGLDSARRG
jgi:hypothetical protein